MTFGASGSSVVAVDDAERLLREHMPLARHLARRGRLRFEALDDVLADAMLGLWDAARRYDPSLGVAFTTFAGHRIVGAIGDGRRERDPLSRAQRRAGDVPNPTSLDRVVVHDRHGRALAYADMLADPHDEIARLVDDDEERDLLAKVRRMIGDLPDDARYVVLRHLAGDTLAAIGEDLGFSESRACQLYGRAVVELRHRAREELLAG